MTTIEETIAARQKAMIPARLLKGAAVIGRLWREGVRCRGEFGPICLCEPKTDFCWVKEKWLALVREFYDGKYPYNLSGNEGILVLECMDAKMFEASGLTIVLEVPPNRAILRIGRKGTCGQTIVDLAAIPAGAARDAAVEAVVKIQQVF